MTNTLSAWTINSKYAVFAQDLQVGDVSVVSLLENIVLVFTQPEDPRLIVLLSEKKLTHQLMHAPSHSR